MSEPAGHQTYNLTLPQALSLALQRHNEGNPAVARQICEQILRLAPSNTDALWLHGLACQTAGELQAAEASYRQTLQLKPDLSEVHSNLGNVLMAQGELAQAESSFQRAVTLKPGNAQAHCNMGNAQFEQGRLNEALNFYREALRLQPAFPDAHYNLGNVFMRRGNLTEAMAAFEQALQLRPDYADAHMAKALMLLLSGDCERGWPAYEWRWKCRGFARRQYGRPEWDGSALEGRTILLYCEQGLGDFIHFVRYAPMVKERGGRVILAARPSLRSLLTSCPGVDEVVLENETPPPFDVQASLLSLPGIFRTTMESIPARVPYLTPDQALVNQWQERLAPLKGFKVGIVWQAGPEKKRDRWKSAALEPFAHLAGVPGVRLISLQMGPGFEQVAAMNARFPIHDLGQELQQPSWSFQDTAALIMNLDLVVSVDTAVVHVAGALGRPCWATLPITPDWRWYLNRDDCPWYPTMRLFRQKTVGQWDGVLRTVAQALVDNVRKSEKIGTN